MPFSFSLHTIGDHRLVRAVAHDDDSGTGAAAHDDVELCLVLDRSGSMGEFSQLIAAEGMPALCVQLGLSPDKQVTLITFDTVLELQRVRVRDLERVEARCRGSTSMRGITEMIAHSALNVAATKSKRRALRLIVVSDGAIDDQDGVVREAQKLREFTETRLGAAAPRFSVCLVRLFTSTSGSPDTRALAALGILADGAVPLHDVRASRENLACEFARIVREHFEQDGLAGKRATLRCSLSALRRSPAEPRGLAECVLEPRGETWLLLDTRKSDAMPTFTLSSEDVSSVGDSTATAQVETPVELGEAAPVRDERQLFPLLRAIDAQLRMRIAATNSATDAASRATFEWLRSAQSALAALETPSDTEAGATAISMRVRDRARQLARSIEKRRGSLLQAMLELANVNARTALNSAQARADFVRAVSATRAGRSVAKRAAKGGADALDFDEMARNAACELGAAARRLEAARAARPPADDANDEERDGPASFYMQDVTRGYIEAAGELCRDADVLDELAHDDVLSMLGLVGIAYEGTVGDVADPWSYAVHCIYYGTYLAQPDLWTAFKQSRRSTLDVPGLRDAATGSPRTLSGVVLADVALLGPESAVAFAMREAPRLLAMHASFSMRHALALLPYDTLAHITSALWHCLFDGVKNDGGCGDDGVSEVWARTFLQLLGALRTVALATRAFEGDGAFAKLAWAMQSTSKVMRVIARTEGVNGGSCTESEVRHVVERNALVRKMCGAEGVSSTLMPFCVLLCAPHIVLDAAPTNAAAVLDATLNFALYTCDRARYRYAASAEERCAKRLAELCALLGVDLAKTATPLQPLGTPEPASVEHCASLNRDAVAERALAEDYAIYGTFFIALPALLAALRTESDVARVDAAEFRRTARVAFDKARSVNTKRALELAEHRVIVLANEDGEKGRLASFAAMHSASSDDYDRIHLMRDQVCRLHREDYEQRAAAKRVEEERLRVERAVDALCDETLLTDFMVTLGAEIPSRSSAGFGDLVERLCDTEHKIPLRADKLFVLLTGRSREGTPAWANGSFCNGKIGAVRAILRTLGAHGIEIDERLSEFSRRYRVHKYRGGFTNRHGHSNDRPSYAALGYASVDAMREAVSTDEWDTYCEQHEHCCGFGGKAWTVKKRATKHANAT